MNPKLKQHFDFSLDAAAFREHLSMQLQLAQQDSIQVLEDDDLALINAAGTGLPIPPPEDDLP